MRGYIDLGGEPVTWRGLSAVYTLGERDLMRSLPVREQAIVHLLKSFTPGEFQDPVQGVGGVNPQARSAVNDPAVNRAPTQYIDHEDIPFGETKRGKRPIYALVWTPGHHRVHKTKKKCEKKRAAWKRWKERQGWTVRNHETGFFAARGVEREAITLHEYDRDTKERVK